MSDLQNAGCQMTHPHDQVCVSPVGVNKDGEIKIFGRIYWSEDSAKLGCRMVQAIVSPAPHDEIALLSLKGERLCKASLLQNAGWADATAARAAARRLKERLQRELLDEGQIVGVAERVEHCPQTNGHAHPTARDRAFGLNLRGIYGRFQRAWQKSLGGRDV